MPDQQWVSELILLDRARVVDGDTIWCYARGFFRQIHYVEIRLNGWDCPEIHGRTQFEKDEAGRAKRTVQAWFSLQDRVATAWMRTEVDTEKYGRYLADIWAETPAGHTSNLGQHLASLSLAVPYAGTGARWRDVYDKTK